MAIELKESGFREWHDHLDGVPSVGVETDRLEECIDHYNEQGFRGLFGSPSFGFAQDNLNFLGHAKNAKWLWLWDVSLKNIDAIYELSKLEYVGINPKRPGIDFSHFPALRTAINHWIKQDNGILKSKISVYHLWHFKPKTKTFDELEIPRGVEELHLYWANPSALDGLPVMRKLKQLQIHRCRNLSDLSALPAVAPKLQELLTTTSSRIDPSTGVLDHPSLQMALIDGKRVLGDGG